MDIVHASFLRSHACWVVYLSRCLDTKPIRFYGYPNPTSVTSALTDISSKDAARCSNNVVLFVAEEARCAKDHATPTLVAGLVVGCHAFLLRLVQARTPSEYGQSPGALPGHDCSPAGRGQALTCRNVRGLHRESGGGCYACGRAQRRCSGAPLLSPAGCELALTMHLSRETLTPPC